MQFATVVTIIVAVVLAVARDVPILEVFGHRKATKWKALELALAIVFIVGVVIHRTTDASWNGLRPIQLAAPAGLVYVWWCIGSRLRAAAVVLFALAGSGNRDRARWGVDRGADAHALAQSER